MYDTPYLRFGAEDYNIDDISNKFAHLTNNSVVKYSKNFYNNKIEGNMWFIEQFSQYLQVNIINYLVNLSERCLGRITTKD
jgi:hypothetical protein